MDYNKLARKIHQNALAHGFGKDDPSDEHCLMLVITELSEMVEADRKGRRAPKEDMMKDGFDKAVFEMFYKNTVEDELADVAIRIMEFAARRNYTLNSEYRKDLLKLIFLKRKLTENAFILCQLICRYVVTPIASIDSLLAYVFTWADWLGIDLELHISMKMQYNETRPMLHGKSY